MVIEIPPAERLLDLGRDRYTNELLIVNLPKYQCPTCSETTVFQVDESQFDSDEQRAFTDVTGPPTPWETVHCDFHCRICNTPVRVICRIHEFAMSSYQYFPLSVYETKVPRLSDDR